MVQDKRGKRAGCEERALRILHIVPRLANSSGPAHIANTLAEAQARRGHEVTILTVTRAGEWTTLPNQSLVEVRSFKQSLAFRNFCYSRSFGKALPSAVAAADVVHIHTIWTYPTWSAMRECVRQGVPYIVAPQGSFEEWALARSKLLKVVYGALFERPLFRQAARFQALTEKEAEQGEKYGVGVRAVVIPNPVDLEAIDRVADAGEVRRQQETPENEKIVLFLGRIFPKKGLELLAEVHRRILAKRDDVTLWIAGRDANGAYREQVEAAFEEAGVRARVRFIGEVYGEHKVRVLKESDVFVLPSYSEGLPVAVLEAMAAGLATVITPGCNLPEVSEREAGWVTEAEPDSLAQAVLEALERPETRRARIRTARELVAARFSSEVVAAETLDAYREVVAEREVGGRGREKSASARVAVGMLRGLLWISSLVLAALILYLSWLPDSRMQLIDWLPEWLSRWADSGGKMQSGRTGVALGAAGFLFAVTWRISGFRHWALGAAGVGLLLVLVAESGQHFLEERVSSLADVFWGGVGAACGAVFAMVLAWVWRWVQFPLFGTGGSKPVS